MDYHQQCGHATTQPDFCPACAYIELRARIRKVMSLTLVLMIFIAMILFFLALIVSKDLHAATLCASQTTNDTATQTITLTASDPAACQYYEISAATSSITMDQAAELGSAIIGLLALAFLLRAVRRMMMY